MRVALIQHPSITLDLAHTGGIEVVELSQLEQLNRRGLAAELYVSALVGQRDHVTQVQDRGWQNRALQVCFYRDIRRRARKADVLHGHYTPLLPLLYPDCSVVHYHGLTLSELPLYRYAACARRYHRAHYVFCAEWLTRGFRGMYPQMPTEHIHVVYNGVDGRAFRPGPKPSGNRVPRIVFYSGWIPQKGIYELLEAIALLEAKRTDFEVVFGGTAQSHYRSIAPEDTEERVRALAAGLHTVRLPGHIAHSDLPALLAGADIGCVPSVYEDPFPLVPLEMMAAGLPVVAFAAGGLEESVVDGETGFLVANRDVQALARALERLIDDEQLRLAMGVKARQRVERYFTWERHVDQLLGIYEQIIRRNHDRRK